MKSKKCNDYPEKVAIENYANVQAPDKKEKELRAVLEMALEDYERERKAISKRLNMRLSILDQYRKDAKKEANIKDSTDIVEDVEPSPAPVNGDQLVRDIRCLISRHVVLPVMSSVAITFWVMLTYCYDQFGILPILGIISPQKRCGKTTLLEVLGGIVNRPLIASNISSAAVYRTIEKYKPTLLVDEADSFLRGNEEMRGVLNSGHTKASAFVVRCDGGHNEPKRFSTFCPKAIALIGKLSGTLADRSIIVNLKRKTSKEQRDKITSDFSEEALDIRRRCKRWANDHIDQLRHERFTISIPNNDRAEDNWEPIVTIAGIVHPKWIKRLEMAANTMQPLSYERDELSVMLLEDIQKVFIETKSGRIYSANLVDILNSMDDRPWSDLRKGSGLTTNTLARYLSDYKIKSQTMRINGDNRKGYLQKSFEDAFKRYIPPSPISGPKRRNFNVISVSKKLPRRNR